MGVPDAESLLVPLEVATIGSAHHAVVCPSRGGTHDDEAPNLRALLEKAADKEAVQGGLTRALLDKGDAHAFAPERPRAVRPRTD